METKTSSAEGIGYVLGYLFLVILACLGAAAAVAFTAACVGLFVRVFRWAAGI